MITIVTPLFLVRILDVKEYGQYREFLLYAMLLVNVIGFGANRSLTYFIPKEPEHESVFLTQTVLFVAFVSGIAILILGLAQSLIVGFTSYNFVLPLVLFCIFYPNLDFVEMYYVAKKRSDIVLYYGAARLILRVSVVVATAYLSRDVVTVINAIVIAEFARFSAVFLVSLRLRLLSVRSVTAASMMQQWRYVWPMGLSGTLIQIEERATNIFVSLFLGPAALALYSIGRYQRPIVRVLRGALADVIFPDMVRRGSSQEGSQLPLWQRSTTAYALLLFPISAILIFNASIIVEVLFTAKYLDAVPLFQIFSLFLVLLCFDFDLPVRALGITRYFLRISWIGLLLRIVFLFLAYHLFGFLGPAFAAVAAQSVRISYLAWKCVAVTGIGLTKILQWDQLGRIMLACVTAVPAFPATNHLLSQTLSASIVGSILYLVVYFGLLRLMRVRELQTLADRVITLLRGR